MPKLIMPVLKSQKDISQETKGTTSPEDQKRKKLQVRLPQHIIKWLREQPESAGGLVERALVQTYKIKEPK